MAVLGSIKLHDMRDRYGGPYSRASRSLVRQYFEIAMSLRRILTCEVSPGTRTVAHALQMIRFSEGSLFVS